jgi:hypothetical protein
MPSVISKTIRTRSLSNLDLQKMFRLFEKYYVDISFDKFREDLLEKDHIFTFKDKKGILIGFSTIFRKLKTLENGKKAWFLFSGDTVIRQDHWGDKFLQKSFFWYILKSKIRSPFRPLYWCLMSKGYKTYKMMRRNFSNSFPQKQLPTPAAIENAMDLFYKSKFGSAYDSKLGLIEFSDARGAVKGTMAEPKGDDLMDPEINFFLERNPEYNRGVELACMAEIRFQDFLGHLPKYFLKFRSRKKTGSIRVAEQAQ